jgi:BirA family biotin operon repressor/biotin-[acetyl-CoA-carboxylase] ligase
MTDLDGLAARLDTRWLGRELRVLDETTSTSSDALAAARAGAAHGLVIIADRQTAGRGQKGRVWHSPPGDSIHMSVVVRLDVPPARVPPVTLAAGVAVCDAVNAFGARASLKWPNDVLAHDHRKLAGILTESTTRGGKLEAVIIGLGVNVGTTAFPDELSTIATSIALAAGRAPARVDVAARVCGELERWLEVFRARPAEVMAAWRQRTHLLGRPVRVRDGDEVIEGVARALDDDGVLVLDTAAGERRLVAGEVLA